MRALAVVVVATPCALILAAPIALVSGLSRAARMGIIVKGAGAIETLGAARTVLFDKTGTLTVGTPDVREILPSNGVERGELLRLAASLDRMSAHVLGEALVADRVGRELGVDRVYADQSPEDKLEVVRSVRAEPNLRPVIMVGDGINDAPALALADLGIAMGAAGANVSSETADAVITVDRIDRVADAVHAGRRAVFIARQSMLTGMGLSLAAMAVAAAGYLPPVGGALFQEAIDLAVILNALRALRG